MTGTLGLLSVLGEHLPSDSSVLIFASTHLLARSVGHETFNMVELTDESAVSEENQIPVPEDKLKEEQKKEYEELVEKFKRECLKSYSVNRSGEVIKKFNLPSFKPLTEAQRESKLWHKPSSRVQQSWVTR